jgi:PAS domain S-box-containing protein
VETGEIRWSEELYRIFDFAPDLPVTLELIGSRVHPEDLPMLGEMIYRAKRGDDQFEYEHRIIMPGGSTKYIHLIGHAVRDAEGHVEYFGAEHDITQRRIAEQALKASERNLGMIINTMPALAWSARPDGEAEFFNRCWLEYTGLSAERSRGWGWMSAIHPDDVNAISDYCQSTLASGKAAEAEARICRIDGSFSVNQLRTLYSKKDSRPEPMDLNEATQEVISLSLSDLQRNRVVLRHELADDLPLVTGDRIQL